MSALRKSKPHAPNSSSDNSDNLAVCGLGLDMVGPLKGGANGMTYLLVMVDKFTKWIEACPVKIAESGPVIEFISSIVHRYGVPHSIIKDNGSNFTAREVKD
jgi:hypothetical protein